MLPDLEHLIRLQQLENSAADVRDTINGIPDRLTTLDARLAERQEDLSGATIRLEEHRKSRASLEKDLAEAQSRINRFRDQLMAVKTNKEYQAMQTEIATAEGEIRELEDQLLERMLKSDDLTAEIASANQRLVDEERLIQAARKALEQERGELETDLTQLDTERTHVVDQLTPNTRLLFETLSRGRKGVAVVEARQGRCTSCQVRLRPQLFNNIRSNSSLIQCESCQRILYFTEHRHVAE